MSHLAVIDSFIPVGSQEREAFFLNENNEVLPLIEAVNNYFKNIVLQDPEGKTDEGRKAIKKLGAEINKNIKLIDDAGKEIVTILKAKPKKIDASRKLIRDSLDELRIDIIKPVIEYEAEQARIEKEKAKKEAEAKRLDNVEHVKTINNKALNDFIANGIDEATAKNVIKLIFNKKISNISINY